MSAHPSPTLLPYALSRQLAQLDIVSVGVDHVKLKRPVGPRAPRRKTDLALHKILLPGVEIIDQKREVIAAVVRYHLLRAFPDQMQLLINSQAKPSARKRERRARNGL